MKIAIISDTHEVLDAQIIEQVKTADIAIHAGDIGSQAVLQSMQPKTGHVLAVAGNNDKPYLWEFKDWDLVKNLPSILKIQLPGGLLVLEHGHEHDMYKPQHDDLRKAHPDARLIVYGHTHIQVIDDNETIHVLNPGAAGHTRNKGGPSLTFLMIKGDDWYYEVVKFHEEKVTLNA